MPTANLLATVHAPDSAPLLRSRGSHYDNGRSHLSPDQMCADRDHYVQHITWSQEIEEHGGTVEIGVISNVTPSERTAVLPWVQMKSSSSLNAS
jgi:hypothetical protein